jgi:putative selenate reductase
LAELIPAPFGHLLRRMLRELEREQKIFDLPAACFWKGSPYLDTSVRFHGRPAGNPVGPAAGPQDQMAQNIVLAWLAGSRILELKTVQVDDRLTIPRPCIDATNVGFNVEWSQELRLGESLREYAAGSMLIDVLRQTGLSPTGGSESDTIFDMSVGYDLAGIRSEPVDSWIRSMKDARREVDALRREIPDDLSRFRDVDYRTALSGQITLSTFHGCPAGEIEGIVRHLLTEVDVDVTVKLNPTLLGRERVDGLLHDTLGYHEIETRQEDFDRDLQWEQALELTDRMSELAASLGRTFQVKFSNTLVVRNHKDFFPSSEEVQYLSGQPLHVLTLNLVERYRRARPQVPISFSAGVDRRNFPDCVALGFTPITTCTDLLRPGGYARLPRYLDHLGERMRERRVTRIGDFVVAACRLGEDAIRSVTQDSELRRRLTRELDAESVDLRGTLETLGRSELYPRLVQAASLLNLGTVVGAVTADPRYRAEQNRKTPRKVGSRLELFDCINCDKCVPVCPNDANFVYATQPLARPYPRFRLEGTTVIEELAGTFAVTDDHQLANFQDFCNECGNCDTFCPEDGGPYVEKPRFFGSLDAWREWRDRDGFFLAREDDIDAAWGRIRGVEYHLEVDRRRDRGLFTDGQLAVEVVHSARRVLDVSVRSGARDGHVLDFSAYLNLAVAMDGVLDPRRANPVNAGHLDATDAGGAR